MRHALLTKTAPGAVFVADGGDDGRVASPGHAKRAAIAPARAP